MSCTCAGTAPGYPQHESWCGRPETDSSHYDSYGDDVDDIRKMYAPWTPAQVRKLQWWQTSGKMHPYTCPLDCIADLTPTEQGWYCFDCGYKQNWAWDFDPVAG